MAKNGDQSRTKMRFLKAFEFLMSTQRLTSTEKLVMIVICRFWPNPFWDSNASIAKSLGISVRYVEKIIKSLATKGFIKRGYAHTKRNGRLHTVRVILPLCFPEPCRLKINWVKQTEHMDGQQAEHPDGERPNSSSFLPEQTDDLLEKNRRINTKATPSPLPTEGQAPALLEDIKIKVKKGIVKFCNTFGGSKIFSPLPQKDFEKKRHKQIKAVLADEKK